MKMIDVRKHTKKHMEITKKIATEGYPNKKIATAGSIFGMSIGGIFLVIGIYGITKGKAYGFGTLLAGGLTEVSNIFYLKRINKAK